MKAIRSNIKISPHGGAVPILKKIKEFGIPQVIRSTLGVRKKQSRYGYEDVFIAWVLTALCGGTRLDHITKLKKKLNIIPGLKLPSHDTLGRVMKKLATEIKTERSVSREKKAKIIYTDYDHNIRLNQMLVKATKRSGALKENHRYTLDIDATFLATECRGAKRKNEDDISDASKIGFSPMVCLIGEMPVYISLRNGDGGPRFQILECLENCLSILNESKIKIGRVISDSAGYSTKVMAMLDNAGIKFNIRFPHNNNWKTFNKSLQNCDNWRRTEIETANYYWNCEIAEINHTMFQHYTDSQQAKTYRVVVVRVPNAVTFKKLYPEESERKNLIKEHLGVLSKRKILKEKKERPNPFQESNWKEIDGYLYKFYITNDYRKSLEEIVIEYNKRGDAEKKFSYMKNDWGWRLPPFSNMNENTVFLIAASLANNIFVGMKILFKKKIPHFINLKARLREFQFIFIDVACAYIDKTYIFYNTDIEYELLI